MTHELQQNVTMNEADSTLSVIVCLIVSLSACLSVCLGDYGHLRELYNGRVNVLGLIFRRHCRENIFFIHRTEPNACRSQ